MYWYIVIIFLVILLTIAYKQKNGLRKLYTYHIASTQKLEETYCRYLTPKEKREKMMKTAERVTNIFSKNNLDIWIGCGALLGYHRHGELIPWDDDIDMECFETDFDKGKKYLEDEAKKNGQKVFIFEEHNRMTAGFYKIHYDDIGEDGIEVFLLKKSGQKTENIGYIHRFLNGKDSMKLELRYPVEEINMNGYTVKKPVNSLNYLNHLYGSDWNKKAYIDPHHTPLGGEKLFQSMLYFDWPVDYDCQPTI